VVKRKNSHELCSPISRISFGVQAKGGEIDGLKDDREKYMHLVFLSTEDLQLNYKGGTS
jgi:hypothetical protein